MCHSPFQCCSCGQIWINCGLKFTLAGPVLGWFAPNLFFVFFKGNFFHLKVLNKCGLNSFFFYVCCGFVKSLIHIIIRFDLSSVFYILDLIRYCHLSKNCQFLIHQTDKILLFVQKLSHDNVPVSSVHRTHWT